MDSRIFVPRFWDVTGPSWPTEEQFAQVSDSSSGLFVFGFTLLRYIGDSMFANPPARLDAFLSFIKSTDRFEARSPLENLDLFYTRILSDVGDDVLPITKRILSQHTFASPLPAQALANLLLLDQSAFYSALRQFHLVVDVPSLEGAHKKQISYNHKSFEDYLCDPARSGTFVIKYETEIVDVAKSYPYWYERCPAFYGSDDGTFPPCPTFITTVLCGSPRVQYQS